MSRICIVGAGIGGLATANLLAKAGHEVHIFEKAAQAGGRAGQLKKDGFTFDTGPSWYLMPGAFRRYFELLGENVEDHLSLTRLSPAYRVFFEHDKPLTITSNLAIDAATFERIEPGAGSALKEYIAKSDEVYQMAFRYFLYTMFDKPTDLLHGEVVRNAHRLLRLSSMPIHRYVSSFVRDRRLQQILEYPMVFLGSSPYSAPALYSLMSALDFKEGVFYPQGGLYTIIESLVAIGKKHGVQFHFNANVQEIVVAAGTATGILLADGTTYDADVVISNVDIHFTETQLLQPKYQTFGARYWQNKEPSPSALLLYLGVQGKVPELEHHNLLFVDAWKDNFESLYKHKSFPKTASMYVCAPSKTDASVAPKGQENLFMLIPIPAGVTLDAKIQDELVEQYLEQFETMTGCRIRDRLLTKTVFGPSDFTETYNAWQGSMLGQSHKLFQSALFRTPNHSKKVANLWYVGANTRPGVGLPMCLIGAEIVSDAVVKAHKKRSST